MNKKSFILILLIFLFISGLMAQSLEKNFEYFNQIIINETGAPVKVKLLNEMTNEYQEIEILTDEIKIVPEVIYTKNNDLIKRIRIEASHIYVYMSAMVDDFEWLYILRSIKSKKSNPFDIWMNEDILDEEEQTFEPPFDMSIFDDVPGTECEFESYEEEEPVEMEESALNEEEAPPQEDIPPMVTETIDFSESFY